MMGERRVMQEALFYGFSLERHVPDSHLLRKIDRFVDLSDLRAHLGPYYSDVGRPSIDPELMMRMLIVGYCSGIRSERRLCEEVHLNLAYRWFCRLGLDGDVPDHSTFSKNRHGRFRESDLLRKLFETVVARCMKEGIVSGEAFAVDASIIVADAHRRRGVAKIEDLDPTSNRAVAEYLSVLDDAAFGGATPVEPKTISPTDPAARYTASANSLAGYAYSDNYLIDLKHAVIMDVEATTTIRQAEVGAAKTMLDRTAEQFGVTPSRLVADGGYGSAEMVGWLVDERGIEPHEIIDAGSQPAETADHQPAKIISTNKHRPAGFEFPACHRCNELTRVDETILAFVSRMAGSPRDHGVLDRHLRLTAERIEKAFPGLVRRMYRGHVWHQRRGLLAPHGCSTQITRRYTAPSVEFQPNWLWRNISKVGVRQRRSEVTSRRCGCITLTDGHEEQST